MSVSRKILIFGGIVLALLGMLYGLHYALFVEHQTLDRMGGSLNNAFVAVANRDRVAAQGALQTYAATKYNYVRQVDAHSHWGGLAMVLIVLGMLFDQVAFEERTRRYLAAALVGGSVLFPFAVLLQTMEQRGRFASVLAVIASGVIVIAMSFVAVGFSRAERKA